MTNFNFGTTGQSGHADTSRGPSNAIWGNAEIGKLFDPRFGVSFFDDFTNFSNVIAESSNAATYGSDSGVWTSREDNSCTPAGLATAHTGVCQLLLDGTDNNEIYLQRGDATSVHAMITDTAGSEYLMAWEARVNVSSIADTTVKWFAGLAEEGSAAANFIGDGGALTNMADKDYIGFFVAEADGDALTVAYNKAGATDQTVLTYGTAIAADTWYKLGMVFRTVPPRTLVSPATSLTARS